MNADGSTPKSGPSPLHLPRVLTSTLLLLVLIGFAVLLLSDLIASRKREYETVQRDSENLARVIDRQIMTAVEKIDVVLRQTARDYAPIVNDGKPRKLLDANLDLQRWMQYTPEVQKDSLRVINKDGRVMYNAGSGTELPNVFVGDRSYFLQQRASKEDHLVISEPLLSRFTNKWLLTLSRPMYDAHGEFGGVVQTALRTEYFQTMFEKLDIGPQSNVSLFDTNLRLLSRHPALPEQIGKQFDTPAKAGISAGLTTFHYENVSKVDAINRLFVFRKLEGLPYLIVIGRSPDEFLYGWYVKAFLYGVAFIGLSLALTSFLFVFYRHTERNRQLIAQVFEASDEAIVVTDALGRVVTANHAFTKITGYELDEVRERELSLLRSDRHPESFYDDLRKQITEHGSWRGEVWQKLKNGDVHPHLLAINTLRNQAGQITNCVVLFGDITALNNARHQAEAANRAKGAFLATMSHEIRTPLNGILGMAQLLLMPDLKSGEAQEFARTILSSGQTLLTLLNDILDLSKVEAGKLELKPTAFSPHQLLSETQALFRDMAQEKNLVLTAAWQGLPQLRYEADTMRLRQILSNLVNNAIKFTATGSISITGREVSRDQHSAVLEFNVRDTGIGVASDKLPLLFQPFSQVDDSNTRQHGGTGLGLSIVRSLTELMGGEAGCSSTPGQGAHFWIRIPSLPLADESDTRTPARTAPMLQQKANASRGAAAHILLVEDNAINQAVIVAMVSKCGYTISCVDNGQKAVATITEGTRPALIIMDCQMPVMDGFAATEKIRAWEAEHGSSRIPIIALTAGAFEADRNRCIAAGMDEFMAKPANMHTLEQTLAKYLRVG